MTALGLIETKGLLAAVECADAMVKAANVRLLERHFVGGGLVTVTVAGEVGAVKASVDAAQAAAGRIQGATLVSAHVIARPDAGLARVIALQAPQVPDAPPGPATVAVASSMASGGGVHAPPPASGPARQDAARLGKLSAKALRQIAESLERFPMTRDEMASAGKKHLIEAIIAAGRQEEE